MQGKEQIPEKLDLLSLLEPGHGSRFVIPVYQRHYTWTANREVKQFLDDLSNVLSGKYKKHFLGILIYLTIDLGFRQRELVIIDGQQRLTTLFLLLYAIKELMEENGENDAAHDLERRYLLYDQYNPKEGLLLKPQVSDDNVYENLVTGNYSEITEDDKKSNVYKNYCYIKDYITRELRDFELSDIVNSLENLYVVSVPITKDDYPQKVFESINATGAKLTASDLIRNFILMPIESNVQEDYYKTYWKKIEDLISPDPKKLESFFRVFLAAKKRDLPNKNAVYEKFVEWYGETISNSNIESILKEIVDYARYYNYIYTAEEKDVDPDLWKTVQEYRKNGSDMPSPLFIEIYSLTERNGTDQKPLVTKKQLAEIIDLTNTYLIRRALCDMDTSSITRMFPQVLRDVLNECNGKYTNIVDVYKKYLVTNNIGNSMEMPDDDKLYAKIYDANMYSLKIPVRLFFEKLELDNNPAPVDLSALNIEHLMPQTPTEKWLNAEGVSIDDYNRNLHRLGNLTLVSKHDNSAMGNNAWKYKNTILKDTDHIKMNEKILQKDSWTIDDIEARTIELIGEIKKLYPYFKSEGITERFPIYIEGDSYIATGEFRPVDGSILIDAGSVLGPSYEESIENQEIEELRKQLLDDESIKEQDGSYVFTKPCCFQQTDYESAADITAKIITNNVCDGWSAWKTEDGHLLKENKKIFNKFSIKHN